MCADLTPTQTSLSLPPPASRHTPHETLHAPGAGQDQVQTQDSTGHTGQAQHQASEAGTGHWSAELRVPGHTSLHWSDTGQTGWCSFRQTIAVAASVAWSLIWLWQLFLRTSVFIQTEEKH